jgi:PBP1b-binding outer membrane lipoprotein LpoB
MKKVILTVALVAAVAVSCKKVEAPTSVTTPDSTTVVVDSVSVDTTAVVIDSVAVTK